MPHQKTEQATRSERAGEQVREKGEKTIKLIKTNFDAILSSPVYFLYFQISIFATDLSALNSACGLPVTSVNSAYIFKAIFLIALDGILRYIWCVCCL